MKKVCKRCGRNRRIGKFSKKSSTPDGKNYYCRDCVRIMNKTYARSPSGKAKIRKCIQAYKKRNKQAIKEYNKDYYIKNKDRIMYNKKVRECTLKNTENSNKNVSRKINKGRNLCNIVIDPKRKEDG